MTTPISFQVNNKKRIDAPEYEEGVRYPARTACRACNYI